MYLRIARIGVCILPLFSLSAARAVGDEPYRFTGESNLPLIVVDTAGRKISDTPKINATLSVINGKQGRANGLSDRAEFKGRIGVEIRGASSQFYDKKSYGFETRDKKGNDKAVSLLGMPKGSDWILYGPYSDKSLMRNFLAYHLSNKIGRYAPRTRFVEVFLRDSEEVPLAEQYVGVYLLVEKIKRGKQRVDVPKLKESKKSGDVSGGYVVRIDRVDGPKSYFTSEFGTLVGHVYPRGDRLDDVRRGWIRTDFSRFERALASNEFRDPRTGYRQHIDVGSFVDCFLLNEFLKNVDAYFLSTYLHKADDGKMHMGPIWDFNLSAANASYGGVWRTDGWMLFDRGPATSLGTPFWWDRLFEDRRFVERLVARWKQLRDNQLALEAVYAKIDETAARLEDPQQRNFQRWPIWGKYVWPNPRPYARNYAEEVGRLKTWLRDRGNWMDANIGSLPPKPASVSTRGE